MLLHRFPAFAVVQLHPIILSILNLARVLQSLGEQIPQIIIVRGLFEPQVPDIAQILIELLCR